MTDRTLGYNGELSDLGTKKNEEFKEKQHGVGESIKLKQELGLISGVSIIVGVMIGKQQVIVGVMIGNQ